MIDPTLMRDNEDHLPFTAWFELSKLKLEGEKHLKWIVEQEVQFLQLDRAYTHISHTIDQAPLRRFTLSVLKTGGQTSEVALPRRGKTLLKSVSFTSLLFIFLTKLHHKLIGVVQNHFSSD